MIDALSVLEQRFDAIVVQAGLMPHRKRTNLEGGTWRGVVPLDERGPQQVVHGVSKRDSPCAALTLELFQHVIIESDRRSSAHDASSIASRASLQLVVPHGRHTWNVPLKPKPGLNGAPPASLLVIPPQDRRDQPLILENPNNLVHEFIFRGRNPIHHQVIDQSFPR
jgi:hypothetical protein